MFGNEFDRPYVLKAPPEGLAALASVIGQVKINYKGSIRRELTCGIQ